MVSILTKDLKLKCLFIPLYDLIIFVDSHQAHNLDNSNHSKPPDTFRPVNLLEANFLYPSQPFILQLFAYFLLKIKFDTKLS